MSRFILFSILLILGSSFSYGDSISHNHGGRTHVHSLPKAGIKHRHGNSQIGSTINQNSVQKRQKQAKSKPTRGQSKTMDIRTDCNAVTIKTAKEYSDCLAGEDYELDKQKHGLDYANHKVAKGELQSKQISKRQSFKRKHRKEYEELVKKLLAENGNRGMINNNELRQLSSVYYEKIRRMKEQYKKEQKALELKYGQ